MRTITRTTFNSIYRNLLTLPGPILSGLSVYIILSYLLVPLTITIPASIIISVLVFGLALYYSNSSIRTDQQSLNIKTGDTDKEIKKHKSPSTISFITTYLLLLLIVGFISKSNTDLFVPWDHINAINILQLISAVALCFFMPGYAVVEILDRKRELEPMLKFLLSYIFSILITGLTGYIMAASGFAVSQINIPLVIVYGSILVPFIYVNRIGKDLRLSVQFNFNKNIGTILKLNSSEILIFASLFALVILSTYYLYGGVIIGDQWFHHGRSLMFISGAFKDLAATRVDILYPPFLSALFASFFTLSGIPSVNAYVSINFLNIIPVFAFYYFFKKWFPTPKYNKSPAMIACTFIYGKCGIGLGSSYQYGLNQSYNISIISSQYSSV